MGHNVKLKMKKYSMCNIGKTACEANCPEVIGTSLINDLKSTDYMCTFFAAKSRIELASFFV